MSIETTGRYLVLLSDNTAESENTLSDVTGIQHIAHAADFANHAFSADQLDQGNAAIFDRLGVAVVSLDPDQLQSLRVATATRRSLLNVYPERIVRAIDQPATVGLPGDYLKGYRDAVSHLYEQTVPQELVATLARQHQPVNFTDNGSTWGLQATSVIHSPYSGLGIRVAVLDTGMDLTHPDFAGRTLHSESFIPGETAQDKNGHGTHCIGTSCGPKDPEDLPRYGIAYNAEIFAGKVLSDEGSGSDGGILAGIEWAITHGCAVISMSLGAPTRPGDTYSPIYEQVGQRALQNGALIIAAAGNESQQDPWTPLRKIPPSPVAYPANAPSLMAVAAIDHQFRIATFSNGSINPQGGQVDIAGPGVEVYSAWPMPSRYRTISGTSMATPHVAGIAALYAEATEARGMVLWGLLMREAQRLALSTTDVGIGLVGAPIS
ncbi:S8 family serine peptidase [Synechococcales cyanobacterium C]|uniref:S8 family serine peptidase n=1 Tax=Petrachloros mirabilis ULC683 TaxID=2781853 RepID=A0A8K2ABW9_9CYAN|nr:S8 family serine peptidase [Petrachloros mirabilis]NCJ05310.1 S8 family serine peptidase [Petrachloros mirabilis ULC683]